MKHELMEILCCPMCKGDLVLTVDEEKDKEIIKGSLFCGKCDEHYPIEDGIPNMLPPDLRE
ncbi:MAG: Trm112 family protein [Methanosarcinales archaeon]|nr:Trm112 family protein [Methanosarcinales archaeon]